MTDNVVKELAIFFRQIGDTYSSSFFFDLLKLFQRLYRTHINDIFCLITAVFVGNYQMCQKSVSAFGASCSEFLGIIGKTFFDLLFAELVATFEADTSWGSNKVAEMKRNLLF